MRNTIKKFSFLHIYYAYVQILLAGLIFSCQVEDFDDPKPTARSTFMESVPESLTIHFGDHDIGIDKIDKIVDKFFTEAQKLADNPLATDDEKICKTQFKKILESVYNFEVSKPRPQKIGIPISAHDMRTLTGYDWAKPKTFILTMDYSEDQPSEDQPSEDQPSEDQPSEDQPSEDQPSEGQPSEDQPSEDQPSEDQPSEDQPSEDQPSEDQPSEDQPSEDQPSEDQPSEDQPSEDQPSEDQPSEDQPSEDQPSEDQPSEDQPSEDQPSEDQPSEDQPSEDQPSEDQPSEDQPSEDQPSEDQPSEDQPSEDQPSEDQPSEDQPSEDQPSEDQPSEDQPSEDQPSEDQSTATKDLKEAVQNLPTDSIAGYTVDSTKKASDVDHSEIIAAIKAIDGLSALPDSDIEFSDADDDAGTLKVTIKNHGNDKEITLTGFKPTAP